MSKKSALEERFLTLWQEAGGLPLRREYKFHPKRRWRADFAPQLTPAIIEQILSYVRHRAA